jgi:hypothetical protein
MCPAGFFTKALVTAMNSRNRDWSSRTSSRGKTKQTFGA